MWRAVGRSASSSQPPRLAAGWRFDPEAEQLVAVARALDLIYRAHDHRRPEEGG
jgi:hypothetical protein